MTAGSLSDDVKDEPYWWEAAPRPRLAERQPPAKAEVAIVGSGYTGLCAAIQTARGGRRTIVIEAEEVGWGCSSRNGGQIGTSIKPSYPELAARFGLERGAAILREGCAALEWIGDFIESEGIACDFTRSGRFVGAHTPTAFAALRQRLESQPREFRADAHLVSRAEQASEIGSDFYHGGLVRRRDASLQPARYHQGLLERALAAGVEIYPRTALTALRPEGDKVFLRTTRGAITADKAILATNGYTGAATPWHRRRIIPIGSYIIATEPLPRDSLRGLFPTGRMVTDTRKLVVYYRTSPDGRRVIFGGRVSIKETDARASAPKLRQELLKIFPGLAAAEISHSWMGFVGYSFDSLPHLGAWDNIHYAMGYCGSGVSLASYLGTRLGQQVLGLAEGRTALDGVAFETRPFYRGNPWFLAPSIQYYRWRDRRRGTFPAG